MNPEAEQVLREILAKNPENLTEYEVNFLNGRRWALNNEQRRIFASVLISDDGVPAEQPATDDQRVQQAIDNGGGVVEPQPEAPIVPEQLAPQEVVTTLNTTSEGVTQESVQSENPYDADPNKFDPDANQ